MYTYNRNKDAHIFIPQAQRKAHTEPPLNHGEKKIKPPKIRVPRPKVRANITTTKVPKYVSFMGDQGLKIRLLCQSVTLVPLVYNLKNQNRLKIKHMKTGQINVQTENIFPIIKKFLYSDHEIFLRELVSNAVDASQKLKVLATNGEYKGELGELKVEVLLDREAKTLT
ncbi:MAG: hypothetical protein ACKO4Y_08335, partial [Flavobacteriales bacterium]